MRCDYPGSECKTSECVNKHCCTDGFCFDGYSYESNDGGPRPKQCYEDSGCRNGREDGKIEEIQK